MLNLKSEDFEKLGGCPWCNQDVHGAKLLYVDDMGCDIVRCSCGLVYARKRINDNGRSKFWADYLTRDHEADEEKTRLRHEMYKVEVDFITDFVDTGSLLDVGCGSGDFMQHFKEKGFYVKGIEYGQEAYDKAMSLGRNVVLGELPDIEFDEKFDLIIFRGTIQYFPDPKAYFEKAFSLLNDGGFIYLYYVNTNSICFSLYNERFSVPITGADYIGYNNRLLNDYFRGKGFVVSAERDFYLGTPYEDWENDILRIAKAIEDRKEDNENTDKGPAFFGNILGTLYKKRGDRK